MYYHIIIIVILLYRFYYSFVRIFEYLYLITIGCVYFKYIFLVLISFCIIKYVFIALQTIEQGSPTSRLPLTGRSFKKYRSIVIKINYTIIIFIVIITITLVTQIKRVWIMVKQIDITVKFVYWLGLRISHYFICFSYICSLPHSVVYMY